MDKKQQLQVRIDQNKADQQRLKDEQNTLEQELAAEEVTYSIGDRFIDGDSKYILVWAGQHNDGEVIMSNLGNGYTYSSGTKVGDKYTITISEMGTIYGFSNFTRYWDSRKKCKC